MKERFGAASLATLDEGRIQAAIDQRIAECAKDIDDRGEDGHVREVHLSIKFTPEVHAGEVNDIKTEIVCSAKVPPRRSRPYSTKLKRIGTGAAFILNEASPDNVRQGTLDEAGR